MKKEKINLENANKLAHDLEWLDRAIRDLKHYNSRYVRTTDDPRMKNMWWIRIKKLFASTEILCSEKSIKINPQEVLSSLTISPDSVKLNEVSYRLAGIRSEVLDYTTEKLEELNQEVRSLYKNEIQKLELDTEDTSPKR